MTTVAPRPMEPTQPINVPESAWLRDPRRSALADGTLLLLTAAAAAACLSGTTGLIRPLLVLAAICLVPGGALLTRLPVKDLLEGTVLAVVLGVSILAAPAVAMVWIGWWHPTEVVIAIAAGSAVLLGADLVRNLRELHHGAYRRGRQESSNGTVAPQKRPLRSVLPFAPALLSLVLWRLSLSGVDVYHLGSYGLPPALPATWYCALAIGVAGMVATISSPRPSGPAMAAHLVVIGIILFGTVPALSPQPHYAWVYKHIGVVQFFEKVGHVDTNADIYNRWPGFFALAAMLSPLAGRANPVTYAAWADVFFLLLDAALVAAVVNTFTRNIRIVGGAVLLFVLTNWVGQTYFSPQAFGFVLGLGVLLIMLRHLRPADGLDADWLYTLLEWLGRTPQEIPAVDDAPRWPRWAAIAAVLGVWAILVASHQLTPYLILASVAVLMIARLIRPWWLLLPMAAMAVAYLMANLTFVQQHYGLFTSIDPFNNVQGVQITPNTPVAGKVFNTNVQLVLIAALWGSGLIASIRLLRRGLMVKAVPFLILAACPFFVVFGQSYGGEAPLRIILFSSPWVAALISWALFTLARPRIRTALTFAIAAVFTVLFVPSYLGQEELNVLSKEEVEASEYFYDHARPGSVLVLAAPGFPYRYGASYTEFSGPEGDANPNLMTQPAFQSRPLGPAQVPKLVARIQEYTPYGYVAFSRSESEYAEIFNITPPGALADFEVAVAHSPRFHLWYGNRQTRIYQLLPKRGRQGSKL